MSRTVQSLGHFALAALAFGACASRQSAATQATAPFDAAKSDAKALAVADAMLAALGGEATWNNAKEIVWFQGIVIDGKLVDGSRHAWDRWNGRHQYTRLDPAGQMGVTMHELFDTTSYAFVEGSAGAVPAMQADKEKMVAEARRRFDSDGYPLLLPYKVKDPGVHLKFAEERPVEGSPQGAPMKYDVIQLTFDPGVGPASGDTWYLIVDKETHIPQSVEHVLSGKTDADRMGFTYEKWVDAGGLKFATVRTTLGYTKPDAARVPVEVPAAWKEAIPFAIEPQQSPGEIVLVGTVKVNAEPTDDFYVPAVK